MRPSAAVLVLALLLGLAVAERADTASIGPQPGVSGVPAGGSFEAEMNCTSCHATSPLNPDQSGRIELRGLPERYRPGERYSLTLRVSHPAPDRLRWGFQLTAVSLESFERAGELVITDAALTQRIDGLPGGRQYVEHTFPGTGIGSSGGFEWSFDWIAPSEGADEVAFFGAGNAANVDGSQNGDWIYSPSPSPIARVAAASTPEPEAADSPD